MNISQYWSDCLAQNAADLRRHFHENAIIRWHNTKECFSLDEFVIANCQYPGRWSGTVERAEMLGDLYISVTHVFSQEEDRSFHVTSFMQVEQGKIRFLDEYWGEDGSPPTWRREKNLGCIMD